MFPPNEGSTFDAQIAESGFLQRNCAILTAFRGKNKDQSPRSIEDNRANNAKLKYELLQSGIGIIPVDGCFKEAREDEATHEDSYFVYDDGKHNARDFFTTLYQLSEKYEQDSCKKQVFDQQFSEKLVSADFGKQLLHILIDKAVMRQRAAASLLGA